MAHEHIVYMMLVDAAASVYDETGIRRNAPHLEQLASRDDHQPYLAIAHRAMGVAHRLAGEHNEAEMRLNQALELFEARDLRWQVGRSLHELGELAISKSETEAANDFFSRARSVFEEMGAIPDLYCTEAKIETLT